MVVNSVRHFVRPPHTADVPSRHSRCPSNAAGKAAKAIRRIDTIGVALFSVCIVLMMPGSANAQDVAAGERVFRQRCGACHTVQPGQNRVGPSLSGIVGRQAGSVEGARYSQGMRDLGVAWDAARLDTYLANPRAMVPGTTMTIAMPNAADRANIIAYLAGLPTSN